MKSLLIVCDGMGDRLTNGKTPLEAAKTPNMDYLARNGINGIMDTVGTGVRPGSDTSHLSLFGYDPYEVYTGRGPFEAYGAGLTLQKGDVALRCNFATVKNAKISDRRAGRDEEGLEELAKALDGMTIEGVKIMFRRCMGHRAVMVLRGKDLSPCISETDAEEEGAPVKISMPLDEDPKSKKTADVLNKFTQRAQKVLEGHIVNKERVKKGKVAANVVLARGAGISADITPFEKKHGLKAACVSATSLIMGVCRAVGMDVIEVEGANGHIDSDIGKKADAALAALETHDFVFLHIKGTDEASHDGKFDVKTKMIERIDAEVIGRIIKKADLLDTTIALTADHSTPLRLKQHSADPVPLVIFGDVRTDDVVRYTERECAKGGLHRICGRSLMGLILDTSNHSKLFGA